MGFYLPHSFLLTDQKKAKIGELKMSDKFENCIKELDDVVKKYYPELDGFLDLVFDSFQGEIIDYCRDNAGVVFE